MRIVSILITALAREFRCSRREVVFRLVLEYIQAHGIKLSDVGNRELQAAQFRLLELLIDLSGRIDAIGLSKKIGSTVSQAIEWIMVLGEQGRLNHLYAWHESGYCRIINGRRKAKGLPLQPVNYDRLIRPSHSESHYDPRAREQEPTLWQMAEQMDSTAVQRKRGRPEGSKSRLTNRQYAEAEPLLPEKIKAGRPPLYHRKQIIEAILYRLRTGCTWESLPSFFPPWRRVYNTLWRWQRSLSGCKALLHWISQQLPT